jgi:hypothetical protein
VPSSLSQSRWRSGGHATRDAGPIGHAYTSYRKQVLDVP